MNHSSKNVLAICVAITAFLIVALTSANIGYYISFQKNSGQGNTETSDNEFTKRYSRLNEVYTRLTEEYYKEVDPDTLLLGAIDGMMASLNDRYTFYYTPEVMTSETEHRDGNYVGIGISLTYTQSGEIYVVRVFKDGPAFEAGIQVGDVLISANGYELHATSAQMLSDAIGHIKGAEGSVTSLTIRRDVEVITVEVECRSVVNTRVEYRMLDNDVGYIALYEFWGDAASAMENALAFMQENHAESIILDLRDNTGGDLSICLAICNDFLPEGVIVYTENRNGEREYYYSDDEYYEIPMAVLVNHNSASASEILAAAIQDYGRGTLLGETTFGKGIVQTCYQFPVDGAGMQLTTSAYYTPKGRSIHETGVTPDIVIESELDTESIVKHGITIENDNVLRSAWELLSGKKNESK